MHTYTMSDAKELQCDQFRPHVLKDQSKLNEIKATRADMNI